MFTDLHIIKSPSVPPAMAFKSSVEAEPSVSNSIHEVEVVIIPDDIV